MKKFITIQERRPDDWELCFVIDGHQEIGKWLEWDPENNQWYDNDYDEYTDPDNTVYLNPEITSMSRENFLNFFKNLS